MIMKRTRNQLTSTPIRIPKTRASWMEPPPNTTLDGGMPPLSGRIGTMRGPRIERTVLTHSVTFIPGDGTGPELAEATRRVLEATGVEFDWDFQDAGIDVYEEEGNPL